MVTDRSLINFLFAERNFIVERRNVPKKRIRHRKPAWLLLPSLCLVLVLIISFWLVNLERGTIPMPLAISEKTTEAPSNVTQGDYARTDTPWYLTLVNKWNPLPENYDLELVEIEGGELVDKRIYDPLMEMLDDAKAEDLAPIVVSGYRTQEKQQSIMDKKIDSYRQQGYSKNEAKELAQQWVAVAGNSEHQLGLAVDINGTTYDIYLWLQENSYKYGFIFRYPGYKTEITGVAEEVWHYRYVGVEAATEIYEQGVCLEEYLQNLN